MTLRSLARRYAAALFDVVVATGQMDQAERDLSTFVSFVAAQDDLRKVFQAPAVPADRKRAILDDVLAATGGLSAEVTRLLQLLADRNRLWLVTDVAEAFAARVLTARRIMLADVTTAVPLADDRRAGLANALSAAVGADVRMTEHVDPSIIGGVVARVGSVVYDGSVTRQLERIRQQLLAGS